ncbi:MAG: hypothetical protein C4534_11075 [Gaiellales bacterium]|nr:MAG: hypothetical protein C4534_11075 [Gaiellales bacterium]
MGLALDEPNKSDQVFDKGGITFVVDNGLMNTCGGIRIDFVDDGYRSGFSVTSTVPMSSGSCGSSCGTSSSGSCSC